MVKYPGTLSAAPRQTDIRAAVQPLLRRKNPMKKVLSLILALALLGTCALAYGEGTGQAVYTNEWALADGLTYENAVSYNSADDRVETFTLTLEPGSSVYPIVWPATRYTAA